MELSKNIGNFFSITIGSILVIFGFAILIGKQLGAPVPQLFSKLLRQITRPMLSMTVNIRDFVLGVATGLLPCMTLTPAYMAAAAPGTPIGGSISMFAFFLGTLPVMLLSPSIGASAFEHLQKGPARYVAGSFLMVAGILTILRGVNDGAWLHMLHG